MIIWVKTCRKYSKFPSSTSWHLDLMKFEFHWCFLKKYITCKTRIKYMIKFSTCSINKYIHTNCILYLKDINICAQFQWWSDKCLTHRSLTRWFVIFVAFDNFHGIHTPILAYVNPSVWCHQLCRWEELCIMSSKKLLQTWSETPLHIFNQVKFINSIIK